jgi:hypothetical protein
MASLTGPCTGGDQPRRALVITHIFDERTEASPPRGVLPMNSFGEDASALKSEM